MTSVKRNEGSQIHHLWLEIIIERAESLYNCIFAKRVRNTYFVMSSVLITDVSWFIPVQIFGFFSVP